jgi:hypothetical protein
MFQMGTLSSVVEFDPTLEISDFVSFFLEVGTIKNDQENHEQVK